MKHINISQAFEQHQHGLTNLDLTDSFLTEITFDRKPSSPRLFAVSDSRLYYSEDECLVQINLQKMKHETTYSLPSKISGFDCWDNEVLSNDADSCPDD